MQSDAEKIKKSGTRHCKFYKSIFLTYLTYCIFLFVCSSSCTRDKEVPTSNIDPFHEYINSPRPSPEQRVYDNADLINYKSSLESHLDTLYKAVDIDMVVITIDNLDGDNIDDVCATLLSSWKIGNNTNGLKGMLFVLSKKEQLVRFEVGYDLEWIYPDSFVGYIERDQMEPFFNLGRVEDGISATLEMIIARANEKIDKHISNPDVKTKTSKDTYFSGGAGARKLIEIGIMKIAEKINYPEDIRKLLVPQPTPAEAYLLDREKCKRHIRGYDFDLYTNETREISKNWVFTKAQMDNQVRDTEGKSFKVFIKDDLAIVAFEPKYRNCPSIYLKRNEQGWQLDYATMSKKVRFDMRNFTHVNLYNNPYKEIFKEAGYTFAVNGFMYYKQDEPPYLGVNMWDGNTIEAKIGSLVKDGPGEKAGLKLGDVIIKVGDINVKSTHEIVIAENKYNIGETVKVKVKRYGLIKEFDVRLEAFDPYKE